MLVETGSKHCVGITPLGKISVYGVGDAFTPAATIAASSVWPCAGNCDPHRPSNALATGAVVRLPVRSPKLPPSWLLVNSGTGFDKMPCFTRRPSYDAKKNVLSFLIGPPSVAPNWFC